MNENDMMQNTTIDSFAIAKNEVSERERILCDEFLEEYYKDYDAERACLRLGVLPSDINKALLYFYNMPYVQQKLAEEVVLGMPDKQDNINKAFKFVVGKLRNIADSGSNKERVDACKQLALLYGLNKPVDIRTNNALTNVIMSPSPVSDAEWEEQASVTMEANFDGH